MLSKCRSMRFVTIFLSFIFILSSRFQVFASDPSKKLSQIEYVSIWSNVAVELMLTDRIPASITLAQGILESGNGNSPLAIEAKNHFGIKCGNDWKGDKSYFDDDKKQECFRKYESAQESYSDHSLFLKTKPRYASLFQLPIDDYEAWSIGLKSAGYATSPTYADRLIELIVRLKLYEYDEKSPPKNNGSNALAQTIKTTESKNEIELTESAIAYKSHELQKHKNDIDYIIAQKGDTYYKISKEFKVGMWQLYQYNNYGAKKDLLAPGDLVYLEPKRNHSKEKNAVFIPNENTSLVAVSQQQGIKLKALMKLNEIDSEDAIIQKNQQILLR